MSRMKELAIDERNATDLRFDFLATLAPSARVEAAGNILHQVALSLWETGGLKVWQVRGELQKLALRWRQLERAATTKPTEGP